MKNFIKTILLTFGILILLFGSLGVISLGTNYFAENKYCKEAEEHYEKAKKLLQENKLKEAERETSSMERVQSYCNENRAAAKTNLITWSAATILGLLMTIGGFFIRGKTI